MSKYTTDTTPFPLPPESKANLYLEKVKEQKNESGVTWYNFTFTADGETPITFTTSLFKNQMGDLLKALGAKEIAKDKYEWDDDLIVGQWVQATVTHILDKKGNKRVVLKDIVGIDMTGKPKTETWDNEESPL